MADRADARGEHDAHTEPDADPVREEVLPVHFGYTGHHHGEDVERAAGDDQMAEVSRVEERSGEAAQQGA